MIALDPTQLSAPLRRPWQNGIAVGRAYDLTRADLLAHLAWLQREIGFRTCRFHAVFHDDMAIVRRRPDGSIIYQWHHLDKVYDALLALGLKPFVELNPMPTALASGGQEMFHYRMNVTPPARWEEWHDLVRAFALHCVERYGLPEVRTWHFEVWNEPNLSGFWSGTKEDYFQLYAHAARALKSVDADLRVGGPASSKAHWLADLIEFCTAQNVPLDFISTHLYPQDEFVEFETPASSPHAPGAFFTDIVRGAKATVAASSRPDLPIHWTEWNTQLATCAPEVTWNENRYVDALNGASFVARHMVELDDAADSFIYWVASDLFEESPIPNAPFSRTYGLLSIHGVPKATGNAFRLLSRMRGPCIAATPSTPLPPFCGLAATLEGRSLHALLWHDTPPQLSADTPAWTSELTLSGRPGDEWIVTSAQIGAQGGSPFEVWEAMGSPQDLSPAQMAALRARAEPAAALTRLVVDAGGQLRVPFSLAANEVLHLELRPRDTSAIPKSQELPPELSAQVEAQLGEKSRD